MGFLFTAANELRTYYAPVATIQDKSFPGNCCLGKKIRSPGFFTHGKDIYMLTYKDAPNYKITKTNIETPGDKHGRNDLQEAKIK